MFARVPIACVVVGTLAVASTVSAASPTPTGAAEAFRAGRSQEAAIAIEQALRSAGDDAARAELLFDLGACQLALDDLAAAQRSFTQSLALFEGGDEVAVALALEGLAAVLLRQENPQDAQARIHRALAIRLRHHPPEHPQCARLFALAGMCAQQLGQPARAESLYGRALAAYRRIFGNFHPRVADIIQNLGTFYAHDRRGHAEIMFVQGAAVGARVYGAGHPEWAANRANHGRMCWASGRLDEAERHLTEAADAYARLGAQSRPDQAACLLSLGRVLLARGDDARAAAVLVDAATVYEAAWWRGASGLDRSLVVDSPYGLLAIANLRLGRDADAFDAVLNHAGRTIEAAAGVQVTPARRAERDTLVARIARCEEQVVRCERDGDRARLPAARAALAAAEERWARFQDEVRGPRPPRPGAAELGRRLPAGSCLVGWLDEEIACGRWESWAWRCAPDGRLAWRRSARDRDDPHAEADRCREGLCAGAPAIAADLRRLSRDRLAVLSGCEADLRRLYVVPSGALAGFPVGLLTRDSRRPLLDDVEVTCVSSPGFAPPPRARADRALDRALVVADPDLGGPSSVEVAAMPAPAVLRSAVGGSRDAIGRLPRLHGSRREAATVAARFPESEVLLGPDASERALDDLALCGDLADFDVVHLATHALVDAERPTRSALVLSPAMEGAGATDDGLLTAGEIADLWRLDAELVALSACESGLGRRADGEGYVGFTQALLGAGARHVLVSLWPIDDQATALLMDRFYANLATGRVPAPAALREAQLSLRHHAAADGTRPFADPRFWGGFLLYGALD